MRSAKIHREADRGDRDSYPDDDDDDDDDVEMIQLNQSSVTLQDYSLLQPGQIDCNSM